MNIEYRLFNSIPNSEILDGIVQLHKTIFHTADNLVSKMESKPQLLVITAMVDQKVIGYKIGYEKEENIFYSWLGGVDSHYRNLRVASTLLEMQHHYLKQNGYDIVQTKTMNRWRSMLLLNIKNGFDIIDTYIDEKGLHKIVLEKKLSNNEALI